MRFFIIESNFLCLLLPLASLISYYQLVVESATASTRRLSLVTHDTRINPYISKSNNVLFKFVSLN